MKELGSKWNGASQEVRAAEVARRRVLSERVSSHIAGLSPEDRTAWVGRMSDISHKAKRAKYERAGNTQRGIKRGPTTLSDADLAARNAAISSSNKARADSEADLRHGLKLRNKKTEVGSREHVPNGVWAEIEPFVLRNALTSEIMDITGFGYQQVSNAIYVKVHAKNNPIPEYSSPQNVKDRQSRSHQGKRWGVPVDPIDPASQERENAMIRAFLQKGLITDELSYWNALNSLYQDSGRALPEGFTSRLRLEVFLRGLLDRHGKQDASLARVYKDVGQEIDPAWFSISLAIEERFISRQVEGELAKYKQGPYMIKDGVVIYNMESENRGFTAGLV